MYVFSFLKSNVSSHCRTPLRRCHQAAEFCKNLGMQGNYHKNFTCVVFYSSFDNLFFMFLHVMFCILFN